MSQNQPTNAAASTQNSSDPVRDSAASTASGKKKEFEFYEPLPIEAEVDHEMIAYAKAEGITDESLLTGRMSRDTCNILSHAKLKHRTSLKREDWNRDNYYRRQGEVLDQLLVKAIDAHEKGVPLEAPELDFVDNIERVNYNDLTEEEFLRRYEFNSTPVIIKGVTDDWAGRDSWRMNSLIQRFGNSKFKIGESDSGRKLKVTLKQYFEYVLYGRDDSPLYLFESSLEEHPEAHVMQQDYTPPKYFKRNLFKLLKEDEMPPHRWFLIGPKRSGTEMHQDPLGTSAWNSSVQGYKRWILIPPTPSLHKKYARGRHVMKKGEDDEAIHFFDFIWPRLKQSEMIKEPENRRFKTIIECIQGPGDTIFVPGGWWHAVQNLDNTIAITENVCNEGNFDRVWLQTRKSRKRLSYKWLRFLRKKHPDIYQRAILHNQRDNFVQWRPLGNKPPVVKEGEVTSEHSSSSSSSTSSSSDTSSDDEFSISEVLRDLPPRKERSVEISEFFNSEMGKRKQLRFDREIYNINAEIKERRKALKKARKSKESSSSSSSPTEEQKQEEREEKREMKQTFECKQRNRSRSRNDSPEMQYSGGEQEEVQGNGRMKKQYE